MLGRVTGNAEFTIRKMIIHLLRNLVDVSDHSRAVCGSFFDVVVAMNNEISHRD